MQACSLCVNGCEGSVLSRLSRKKLHQKIAADAHRLLDNPVLLRDLFLRLSGQLPAYIAHFAGRHDKQRHDKNAKQSQLPVHNEQRSCSGHKNKQVARKIDNRVVKYALHAGDVTGHSRNDLSLLHFRGKLQRHPLKVAVHLVFHIMHNI
ncbi:hypothetical protein D3C80_1361470 [compost metagenome]